MSDKHFQAILAKNGLAEKLGEILATDKINSSDMRYIFSCLRDIEAYIGVGNQPDIDANFEEGNRKVHDNPVYYGL